MYLCIFLASQILNSGTLLLTNVSSKDNGQYTCSVTNTYVHENAIFLPSYDTLNVVKNLDRKAPQFSYPPQSRYNVQAGKTDIVYDRCYCEFFEINYDLWDFRRKYYARMRCTWRASPESFLEEKNRDVTKRQA